jgi:hypothetical protein
VEEVWKDVPNFEGLYQVSNFGQVKSLARVLTLRDGRPQTKPERILKQATSRKGYKTVKLCNIGEEHTFQVHRLVAEAFIPNPDNLPQVNHKDEIKYHNFSSNLEWCTNDYNINYGTGLLRGIQKRINGKLSKAVLQFNLLGKQLAEFPSVNEAARRLGNINRQCNIVACCNGSRETAYGYVWKYK